MFNVKIETTAVHAELESGHELIVKVDHLDCDQAFEFNTDIESTWMTRGDLMEIKRVINKALRDHKNGFKA